MVTTKNLNLYKGSTFEEIFNYVDSLKNPIDISAYQARSQMRRSYYAANSVVFSAEITDSSNGKIKLNLDHNISANIVDGRYVYDLEIYDANTVVRIFEGLVTVYPEATR
jgi:hypothetical protein